MTDNRPERSEEAGNRSRDQRQRARTIIARMDRWEMPGDEGGKAHRRNRQRQTRIRRPR